jgi:hypothetical protein
MRHISGIRALLLVAAIWVTGWTSNLHAQDSTNSQKQCPWYESIAMNGLTSASVSYNVNIPDSRKNQLRVFDIDDNSFKIDVIELSLQQLTRNPGDVGFCIHLAAGSSVPKVARSSGLDIGDLDFHQMYIRYVAEVGRGLTVDLGKFVTPLGYEVIEGFDGYNDNATRSFLFGYAIPFTHTGVRLAYPLSDAVTGTIIIVNGWDNAIDNNRSKTIGGQLALTPVAGLVMYANAIYGPEMAEDNSDNRGVVDVSGSYVFSALFTLGINGTFGTEQRAAPGGGNAVWNGAAVYVRFTMSEHVALILRGEHFEDHAGARTGVAQTLHEVTLTPEFRPVRSLVIRGDVRLDMSTDAVFGNFGGVTDRQFTVCANVLFVF